jgi:hypothetical protein
MRRISGALLTISLAACTVYPGTSNVPGVTGQVDFGDNLTIQASMADVAIRATVSLIDASTNNTVSSTITDAGGAFNMTFLGWAPSEGGIYYFEAMKGLGNNQAGNSAARVRTMARYSGGSWQSIAIGSGIWLSRTTTAISTIASLRGSGVVPPSGVIQKLLRETPDSSIEPHTPETLSTAGTGITNADFHLVYGLVTDVLTANEDPMARIVYDGGAYKKTEGGGPAPTPSPSPTPTPDGSPTPTPATPPPGTPPSLLTLAPQEGLVGTQVTLLGENFATTNASNSVSFNGTMTTPLSSSPTKLIVAVPTGATTGNVLVITSTGTSSARPFTVNAPNSTDIGGSM